MSTGNCGGLLLSQASRGASASLTANDAPGLPSPSQPPQNAFFRFLEFQSLLDFLLRWLHPQWKHFPSWPCTVLSGQGIPRHRDWRAGAGRVGWTQGDAVTFRVPEPYGRGTPPRLQGHALKRGLNLRYCHLGSQEPSTEHLKLLQLPTSSLILGAF